MKKTSRTVNSLILLAICLTFISSSSNDFNVEDTFIYPIPQEMKLNGEVFEMDEKVTIVVPENVSEKDLALAHYLVGDLSSKYSIALSVERSSVIPEDRKVIVMGTINNTLIRKYCSENKIEVTQASPGNEGYILQVSRNLVVIGGWDDAGAFYGLQSLRQLLMKENGKLVQGMEVRDWPNMPYRGVRLFVPGPENIAFFNRYMKDFLALYKYNKIIMEVNCMRLDKHPEVNAGWIEFSKYMQYTRTNSTEGLYGENKNSTHHDAGDGFIIEKEDMRNIVKFASQNFLEVVPEIPSLTHGYYLLTRHPELAEYPGDIWPDTYCPSNPDSYKLMFDVFDEYMEVMQPKMVHIGHDEWWGAPLGNCEHCEGKDHSMLFADDILKNYNYFKEKGITVAMWGDYLLESLRDTLVQDRVSSTGVKYQTPGAVRPEVVMERVPKDILIFNWFWQDPSMDWEINDFGFTQVYGNMEMSIPDWDQRRKGLNVIGGAHSSWVANTEFNMGKDDMASYLGCANLLWSQHTLSVDEMNEVIREIMPSVSKSLSGQRVPSQDGDPVVPIDISSKFNIKKDSVVFNRALTHAASGQLQKNSLVFNLSDPENISDNSFIAVGTIGEGENPLSPHVEGIPIHEDVSSLIFLHASVLPAENKFGFFNIPDVFDSADLLGYYEVVYEDGYKEIIPIQYAVNILNWSLGDTSAIGRRTPQICYSATPIACSDDMENNPVTFYAFEWVNARYGKAIKEVNLHGTENFEATRYWFGQEVPFKPLPSNAIILAGISKVVKRPSFIPKGN